MGPNAKVLYLCLLWVVASKYPASASEDVSSTSSEEDFGNPRTRRTLYGGVCPHGCTSCSAVNGCVTCKTRYFLYLHRNGIRQSGVCVATCPEGHIEMRTGRHRHCARCRVNGCDICLTRNYCSQCHEGSFSYRGRCFAQCPDGFLQQNSTRECLTKLDCAVSEWSPWSVCTRVLGKPCEAKFGVKTRVREIIRLPLSSGSRCPPSSQHRRCRLERAALSCSTAVERPSISDVGTEVMTSAVKKSERRKKARRRKKMKNERRKSSSWNRSSGMRSRIRPRNRNRTRLFKKNP